MDVIRPFKEYFIRDELNRLEEDRKNLAIEKEELGNQQEKIDIEWTAIQEEWEKINKKEEKLGKNKKRKTKKDVSPKSYSLDEIRLKYPNAYKLWTVEDDVYLTQAFLQNQNVRAISKEMQRQPGAINARLHKLKLKQ